ncbi:MAG: site-specific DNA-methyltransferase [Flavobacteriales bacterium]
MPKSYKHSKSKRAHIPSKEEAGYESASQKVKEGPEVAEYDKTPKYFQGNPVNHRGQDPELWWMNKYGEDDGDDRLKVDIRSLYRHEHIAPEKLIEGLYKTTVERPDPDQLDLFNANELFGNALEKDELEKVSEYYQHSDGWSNRLIQGDSLLVMSSLLEREGMAGQVQCIYIDPPYGIKYNSNWQMKLNDRNVKDGSDEHLSGEPEMIKAFRDTWEFGIHSFLSYLRDRFIVARDLLNESGSCFIQISDDNVHLVRCLMDEVFGSENFLNEIVFSKSAGGLQSSHRVGTTTDFIIWYAKDKEKVKYRPVFEPKDNPVESGYTKIEMPDGKRRSMTLKEKKGEEPIPEGCKNYMTVLMTKPGPGRKFEINVNGVVYDSGNRWWGTTEDGLKRIIDHNRYEATANSLRFVSYFDDFPFRSITNLWNGFGGAANPQYVVQTNDKVIARCLLMTTDPGDVVIDPTCGSGTTAYVAEQWGRRWITIDTSRIALNIAKTRLMTATYSLLSLAQRCEMKVDHNDGKARSKKHFRKASERTRKRHPPRLCMKRCRTLRSRVSRMTSRQPRKHCMTSLLKTKALACFRAVYGRNPCKIS